MAGSSLEEGRKRITSKGKKRKAEDMSEGDERSIEVNSRNERTYQSDNVFTSCREQNVAVTYEKKKQLAEGTSGVFSKGNDEVLCFEEGRNEVTSDHSILEEKDSVAAEVNFTYNESSEKHQKRANDRKVCQDDLQDTNDVMSVVSKSHRGAVCPTCGQRVEEERLASLERQLLELLQGKLANEGRLGHLSSKHQQKESTSKMNENSTEEFEVVGKVSLKNGKKVLVILTEEQRKEAVVREGHEQEAPEELLKQKNIYSNFVDVLATEAVTQAVVEAEEILQKTSALREKEKISSQDECEEFINEEMLRKVLDSGELKKTENIVTQTHEVLVGERLFLSLPSQESGSKTQTQKQKISTRTELQLTGKSAPLLRTQSQVTNKESRLQGVQNSEKVFKRTQSVFEDSELSSKRPLTLSGSLKGSGVIRNDAFTREHSVLCNPTEDEAGTTNYNTDQTDRASENERIVHKNLPRTTESFKRNQMYRIHKQKLEIASVEERSPEVHGVLNQSVTEKVYDTAPETAYDSVSETVYDSEPEQIYEAVCEMNHDTMPEQVFESVPKKDYDTTPKPLFEAVPERIYDTVPEKVQEGVTHMIYDCVPEQVYDTVPEPVLNTPSENACTTVAERIHDSVPERHYAVSERVYDVISQRIYDTALETVYDTVYERIYDPVQEDKKENIYEEIRTDVASPEFTSSRIMQQVNLTRTLI